MTAVVPAAVVPTVVVAAPAGVSIGDRRCEADGRGHDQADDDQAAQAAKLAGEADQPRSDPVLSLVSRSLHAPFFGARRSALDETAGLSAICPDGHPRKRVIGT